MTDKNHEQYLEQIEIAVAETTKELMSKHNGDLRAMAKVCSEKQVEINRLREYQNNDRKTIRNLRAQLAEAVEESNLFQRDIGRLIEDKNELEEKLVLQRPLGLHIANVSMNTEIEKLKDEIECRNSTWETKEKEYEGEIVELKEEIDLYKEELDIAHHEYDKLKEQIQRSTIAEARSARDKALAEIVELKEELEAATAREDSMFQTLNKKRNEESEWAQKKIAELKKTIHQQGDQLAIFHAKEEKPHNASSATAHAVLQIKNSEIAELKEEIELLKNQLDVGGMMNFSKYK